MPKGLKTISKSAFKSCVQLVEIAIPKTLENIGVSAIAKMKTTNETGEVVKQRLNIRSALRKLNEFKQQLQ